MKKNNKIGSSVMIELHNTRKIQTKLSRIKLIKKENISLFRKKVKN